MTSPVLAAAQRRPLGYLFGLTLSTAGSSATFGIAAGAATNSTGIDVMTLSSAFTKTTSAWAVGTAAGSLDTGTIAANTWYHVYLIKRPDTGTVDTCTSLSASAPTTGGNIPAAYTLFRRIGAMKTNASSQWIKFYQVGDEFLWDVPITDRSGAIASTALTALTLTVPTGVQVAAMFAASLNTTASTGVIFTSREVGTPSQYDVFAFNGSVANGDVVRHTDTSAQINFTCNATTGSLAVSTYGWIDTRGKLS
jgi:hypothetical protein